MIARLQRTSMAVAIMLGAVLVVSSIILFVLATVFWLSVQVHEPGAAVAFRSLKNYSDVFTDPFTYRVLVNTLVFSTVALLVSMAFGLPAAWLVERTDLPAKSLIYTLMTIGLLVPGFADAMGWLFLTHPRIGLLNIWLASSFGFTGPVLNIASVAGMGWVQGLSTAPVAFIMNAAVFRAADPSLEDAAQMAGARPFAVAWSITLRLAWPGILAAGIYIFTIGFAAFDVPAIIGWSNRIFTFSTYLLVQLSPNGGIPEYGHASALSSVVIVLAVVFIWWYGRIQRQGHRYRVVTGKSYRPRLVPLGRHAASAWAFLAGYFLLSKLIPILVLTWAALLPYFQLPSSQVFALLSIANFRELPWEIVREGAANTAILMVVAPTVTLALCLAFSWIVVRSKIPGRDIFDGIAFLPHAVPNIVFCVGLLLLVLFVMPGADMLYGTIWILAIAFVIARLSYGTRITNSALIQIHPDLEEAGQMSGASPGAIIARVLLPLLVPALVNAWAWIALLCYRELTLAVLLTTRDNITLPVVVWSIWLTGDIGKAAALALVFLASLAPLIAIYWQIARKRLAMPDS